MEIAVLPMRLRTLVLLSAIACVPALPSPGPHEESSSAQTIDMESSMDMNMGFESEVNSTASLPPSPASTKSAHHHGMPILQMPNLEPQQKAYWEAYNSTTFFNADLPNSSFLWAHISLTTISWVVLFPFVLMMGVEDHGLFLLAQTIQSATAIAALICLFIFGLSCPSDMYPDNAYSKMSVILFFYVIVHWLSVVVKQLGRWAISKRFTGHMDGAEYVLANMTERGRLSYDSGQAEDSEDSEDLPLTAMSSTAADAHPVEPLHPAATYSAPHSNNGSSGSFVRRILNIPHVSSAIAKFGTTADLVFIFTNRPLFMYAYTYLVVGVATGFRMAMGHKVFNLLAHLIKGSVFFLFGLLTLARYLGAFKNHGMAWNIRPGSRYDPNLKRQRSEYSDPEDVYSRGHSHPTDGIRLFSRLADMLPSMEWVECFLVFFYGSTNIFMEHLGNSSGVWSPKDLQHASIAFMYIGGGLCGLLLESRWARKLCGVDTDNNFSRQYCFSFNPFPAFMVFWTGILMSRHAQELELSTEIHSQWGVIFVVGAIFRLLTYFMLYVQTPDSTAPARPFTEIVTSFCLICGGMIFMESNGQTVEAMMYHGLGSMFTLNVNVGLAALIMAYEMVVFTFKGFISKDR